MFEKIQEFFGKPSIAPKADFQVEKQNIPA